MKTTLTRIGNSRGIIIPAVILRQCGFGEELAMEVKPEGLLLRNARKPREGWAEQIKAEIARNGPSEGAVFAGNVGDEVFWDEDEEEWWK